MHDRFNKQIRRLHQTMHSQFPKFHPQSFRSQLVKCQSQSGRQTTANYVVRPSKRDVDAIFHWSAYTRDVKWACLSKIPIVVGSGERRGRVRVRVPGSTDSGRDPFAPHTVASVRPRRRRDDRSADLLPFSPALRMFFATCNNYNAMCLVCERCWGDKDTLMGCFELLMGGKLIYETSISVRGTVSNFGYWELHSGTD